MLTGVGFFFACASRPGCAPPFELLIFRPSLQLFRHSGNFSNSPTFLVLCDVVAFIVAE
jgi:hypothetical protein